MRKKATFRGKGQRRFRLGASDEDCLKAQADYKAVPEDRLPVAILGRVMFPRNMFWFAWFMEHNHVHRIVPTLAGIFFSTSIILTFVENLKYLTGKYLMYASIALAASTVIRSTEGAAAHLFTQYILDSGCAGGGDLLIAGVSCLLAPIQFIFY